MSWAGHYNHARNTLGMNVWDAKAYADRQMELQSCFSNERGLLHKQFS